MRDSFGYQPSYEDEFDPDLYRSFEIQTLMSLMPSSDFTSDQELLQINEQWEDVDSDN